MKHSFLLQNCKIALIALALGGYFFVVPTTQAASPSPKPSATASTKVTSADCATDTGLAINPNCRDSLPTQKRLDNSTDCNTNNPLCGSWFTSVNSLFRRIVTTIILVIDAIALINLLIASLGYITSAGNPEAAKKAKQRIINSVIAIALISSVYVLITLIVTIGSGLAPS
jgi:hypothetical protein